MAQIILDSNNNLIQGDFDNATLNNRTKLQTTTTNATTNVYVVPNGSSTSAGVSVANNSSLTNASKIVMATNGTTDTQIISGVNGSGSYLPLSFYTNNALAMQIGTNGYLGVGTSSPGAPLDVQATNGANSFYLTSTTGTNPVYSRYSNTGGFLYMGRDGSAGTDFGAGAYASALWSTGAYPMVFGTNGTERMRITSNGNLLVNTTTARGKITVFESTNSSATPTVYFANDGGTGVFASFGDSTGIVIGTIVRSGSSTNYNTSSDYRLKENIVPMTGALATVQALKPVTYKWKIDGSDGQGFIAHELQAIVPDCVTGEKDAVDEEGNPVYQGVDTSFLVATLTAAIKEQQIIINELKTRIEALESK
jgi:hypothetical protein